MERAQMDHIIRAAADITGEREFVVIGSQAILGNHDIDAPPSLLASMEADIYPAHAPEKAIMIDGNLGDGSRFHQTFGYYAHGIGPETAKAPAGWQNRLIKVPIEPRPGSTVVAAALLWNCTTSCSPSAPLGASATGITHAKRFGSAS